MDTSKENITLSKETVEGFVDRGGNFRTDGAKTALADRWVSDYFNFRSKPEETQTDREKKS